MPNISAVGEQNMELGLASPGLSRRSLVAPWLPIGGIAKPEKPPVMRVVRHGTRNSVTCTSVANSANYLVPAAQAINRLIFGSARSASV